MTRAKQRAPKALKCVRAIKGITLHTDVLPKDTPVVSDKGVFLPIFFRNIKNGLAYTIVAAKRLEKTEWPQDHQCGVDITVYVPTRMQPASVSTLVELVLDAGEGILWTGKEQVVQANVRIESSKSLRVNAGERAKIEVAVCLYPGRVRVGTPRPLAKAKMPR